MNVAAPAAPGSPARRFPALILLLALPLLTFEVLNVLQLHRAREAELRQEAVRLLDLVEAEQQRIVEDIRHVLVAVAEMGVGRMDPATCRATMARIKARYPRYLSIHVSDHGGDGTDVVWCSTEPLALGKSVAGHDYRDETARTGDVAVGRFMLARSTGRPVVPFALSYPRQGEAPPGIVSVLLDIGWLDQYLTQKSLPGYASVVVADGAGTVLAQVPAGSGPPFGQALPARLGPLLRGKAEGVVEQAGPEGRTEVIAYSPAGAGATDLYVQVSLDKGAAMRPVTMAALRSASLFAALLALTALGASWGVRRFLRIRDQAQRNALRTAAVLASTEDGVVELDREWRFTYLNDRAKTLIAQGRELLGLTIWEAFPELVSGPLWQKAQEAMSGKGPIDVEIQGVRTGRWFWMRAFPSPGGLAIYLLDISARKRVEEELRESKDRLALALASAQAGTFDWDLRTGKGHWSEESYRIFGLDPARHEATDETWLGIVHPEDRKAGLTGQTQYLHQRKPDFQLDYRVLRPDGSARWVSSIGRISYDEGGAPLHFSGLNIDITERKAMEQALRQAKAEAEEANVSKSKFMAAASHDLRQPLQSALLFAGVLRRHVDDEAGQGPLTFLERALDTLKNLLDSLLDMSQLDAGVAVPEVGDVPLGPLIEEIGAAYAPIAASKGLEFRVSPDCAALAVRSDRVLLGRMLRNLVENAIRYTERGHVRVDCASTGGGSTGGGVVITVEDSGIGISADQLTKVFEEFHQVGNPERDRSRGLGLGLAIVQRLSRLLDHPVSVGSEPGRGSAFSIRVPRAEAPAGPPAPPEPQPEAPGQGRLAVLVDDDVIVLNALRTIFQSWGYDVVIAGAAEQAIEGLRADGRVPDIVVADYRLREGKVGTDAIAEIRDLFGAEVPGIVLTGEIGPECERDAAALGLSVVHKPITPRELHGAVDRLLGAAAE